MKDVAFFLLGLSIGFSLFNSRECDVSQKTAFRDISMEHVPDSDIHLHDHYCNHDDEVDL